MNSIIQFLQAVDFAVRITFTVISIIENIEKMKNDKK